MNAKHLFLTLTMLLASITFAWGYEVMDEISYAKMAAHGGYSDGSNDVIDADYFGSSAKYSGEIYFNTSTSTLQVSDYEIFGTTATGGTIKSITVYWSAETDLGEDLQIFLRESPAFVKGDDDPDRDQLIEYTYAGESSTVFNSFTGSHAYVAFMGNSDVYFTKIEIVWEVSSTYAVTIDPLITNGTITSSHATATAGTEITLQITPAKKYSLKNYTFDGMFFDLSCIGYWDDKEGDYVVKFPMPARPVTVTATFEKIDRAGANNITPATTIINLPSGTDFALDFTAKYNHDVATPVNDGGVTYEIGDASIVSVLEEKSTFDGSDGTCVLHGLAVGPTTLIIHSTKTTEIKAGKSSTITINVIPRDVALVAEYSGEYYAMKNTFADNKAGAVRVFYSEPEKRYYYLDGTNLSQLTWNVADPAKNKYTIQNPNNSDRYLTYGDFLLSEEVDAYQWGKDTYKRFTNVDKWGIVYDGTYFLADNTMANAAVETLISNFYPLTYTTASGAAIVDTRTLSSGKYGTMCVPFNVDDVSGAGAEFYELTGKVLNKEGTALAAFETSDAVASLVAGHSYLFKMKDGQTAINFTGSTTFVSNAYAGDDDGFVGCLPGDAAEKIYVPSSTASYATDGRLNGCYILNNNAMHYVTPNATGSARHYRAYINAKELPEKPAAAVPLRRAVFTGDYNPNEGLDFDTEEGVVTGVNELSDPVFINWNEPVYNIMGIRVGKGATGLLIQNGHKFYVQ